MSLQGAIFSLVFKDRDQGVGHPHVVAIELSARTCLVVPCYTPGQTAVNAVIESSRRRFLADHQIFVLINHATCVIGSDPKYLLHEACYILERVTVLDTRVVTAGKYRGTMQSDQLKRIAQGILEMNAANGGNRLSARAIKLLGKFVE